MKSNIKQTDQPVNALTWEARYPAAGGCIADGRAWAGLLKKLFRKKPKGWRRRVTKARRRKPWVPYWT
jgi:hypothetical protein